MLNQSGYSFGEIALMRNVSVKTVYRAVQAGDLAAVRYNARVIRVTYESYRAWCAALDGLAQKAATEAKERRPAA